MSWDSRRGGPRGVHPPTCTCVECDARRRGSVRQKGKESRAEKQLREAGERREKKLRSFPIPVGSVSQASLTPGSSSGDIRRFEDGRKRKSSWLKKILVLIVLLTVSYLGFESWNFWTGAGEVSEVRNNVVEGFRERSAKVFVWFEELVTSSSTTKLVPTEEEAFNAVKSLVESATGRPTFIGSVEVGSGVELAIGAVLWTVRVDTFGQKTYFCVQKNPFGEWKASSASYINGLVVSGECLLLHR